MARRLTGARLRGVLAQRLRSGALPGDLVAGVSGTLREALELPRRVMRLVDEVEVLVAEIRRTAAQAEVVVADADETRSAAANVVAECRAQLEESGALLRALQDRGAAAGPTLERATSAFTPQHVDGTAHLLDLVPELLDLILPALRGLSELSPGMAQLGERLDNIAHIVEGVPGAGTLKRRGTERIGSATS